jgi:hypothetical protein
VILKVFEEIPREKVKHTFPLATPTGKAISLRPQLQSITKHDGGAFGRFAGFLDGGGGLNSACSA